ncbi:MAG: hypothetical protein LQ352_001364 [Teloschistes flavicans]|nr:MAG: hypothetical protein LQ352_001364 [Teloschistes flavicans]
MAFFLPSYFQKRILHYVLSRIDVLDPDQLNLDNFDVVWGRKSVIELREVGLHLERILMLMREYEKKLAALIKLPRRFVCVKARIRLLRITVPADLYSSGIWVEAEGIELSIDASAENVESTGKEHEASPTAPRLRTHTDQERSLRPKIHDPGGEMLQFAQDGGASAMGSGSVFLPTTDDLAESFLQAEPLEEKAQLRAAVTQSQLMSGSDSDMATTVGVGTGLALPTFLSGFLKGVGDRFRLSIRDLRLDVSLRLDLPPESQVTRISGDRAEEVTFRVSIHEIEYLSVPPSDPDRSNRLNSPKETNASSSTSYPHASSWRRQIRLAAVQAAVLSDASVLSVSARSLAQSSEGTAAGSSPRTQQRGRQKGHQGEQLPKNIADISPNPSPGPSSDIHRISYDSNDVPELGDPSASLRDARTTDAEVYMEQSSRLVQPAHTDEYGFESETQYNNPQGSQVQSISHPLNNPVQGSTLSTHSRIPDSQSTKHMIRNKQYAPHVDKHLEYPQSASSRSPQVIQTSSPPTEDLAESKIFSHEEAESMYMSALSDVVAPAVSTAQIVPGAWSEEDETEELSPLKTAPAANDRSAPSPMICGLGPADSHPQSSPILPKTSLSNSYNNATSLQNLCAAQHDPDDSSSGAEPPQLPASQESEVSESTSEGTLVVSRTFMLIDYISISLPQTMTDPALPLALPPKPVEQFPTFPPHAAPSPARSQRATALKTVGGSTDNGNLEASASDNGSTATSPITNAETEVEIGEVEVKSDMRLARLTALVIRELKMNTLDDNSSRKEDRNTKTTPNFGTLFTIKTLKWKFFDRVVGKPADEYPGASGHLDKHGAFVDSELLLRADIDGFKSISHNSNTAYTSKMSVSRVAFGYATGDILSFDSTIRMRESTRDILAPIGEDMVLTVTKNSRSSKIELSTLPVNIRLDLRRLDETFGWLGGLSSILDLGTSMISTVTSLDHLSQGKKTARKPGRGVRFDLPSIDRPAKVSSVQGQLIRKITARIGGINCTLQGSESSLRLEGTALKLVSRAEGLGLQVDRLNLSGPNIDIAAGGSAMTTRLSNVRVELLSEPKEADLDRLVALLSPSRDKYERDDDILLGRLLDQRRQGSVLRLTAEQCVNHIASVDDLLLFPILMEELKKLGTVTKYLPDDDRPGILSLVLVRDLQVEAQLSQSLGTITGELRNVEVAHVTLPSLVALGISTVQLCRNQDEELLAAAYPYNSMEQNPMPTVLARFIGNEMEPTVKIKLQHLRVEYHVPFVLAVMEMATNDQREDLLSDMACSIATMTERQRHTNMVASSQPAYTKASGKALPTATAPRIDVTIRDSLIGLNPQNSQAKGVLLLMQTHFVGSVPEDTEANAILEVQKAALMIIDDQNNVKQQEADSEDEAPRHLTHQFEAMGYVSVSSISAARASMQVVNDRESSNRSIEVDVKDDLFVLESCADSTQTLQAIFNGLVPPVPPSKAVRYRTEVVPIEDMLASFSGVALTPNGEKVGDNEEEGLQLGQDDDAAGHYLPEDLDLYDSLYASQASMAQSGISDSMLDDDPGSVLVDPLPHEHGDPASKPSLLERSEAPPQGPPLEFQDDHFGGKTSVGGTAHRWNTTHDTYGLANEAMIQRSPLRLRVRDVHVIWNLFDGYDWQRTRDTINKAFADVEIKALDRMSKRERRKSQDVGDDEESVIGDFLFNSIYIGIPANRDPRHLAHDMNRKIDEFASETDSTAPSTVSSSPSRPNYPSQVKSQKLRLTRSKHHKMTFELKGICADLIVFPPGSGETQSSIDVRVQDLEIFDHVPTSTWKKFATYMQDAGERESGTSMVHLEILNVRPVADLVASEIIIKATVLPLRLHVDQDALDFMTRFFEFKDENAAGAAAKSEAAFLQRVEINSVRLRLDFKPKRVDYAGIRSGHTNEFMNFFILDRADMVLRHVIIYGIPGFDRLGKTLNDIWMPDIKRNQLPGVLAGLAPVRSLANVGGGVRDLVVVPIHEYQKDGRIVRSFQKGALAFAKTTTSELVKLGAKLAIGTQTVLSGAEDLLTQPGQQRSEFAGGWEEAELDEEEKKRISLYADQPVGVIQGLRGAYASLERDLLTAKDAIVAIPGEVMESGTAGGAAKAVLKSAPTIILRPALGVSKAVGQTLMGATNSLDPANRRRIDEVSSNWYHQAVAHSD